MKSNDRKTTYLIIVLILVIVIVDRKYDFINKIYDKYEDYRLSKIEQISNDDNSLQGNSQSNINNYALISETKDSFVYAQYYAIFKSDKNFDDTSLIVEKPKDQGKDTINVVGDWVFYRQGKEMKRVKKDGSSVSTIFNGYSFDMRIIGDWIYFINFNDDKVYKMDLNGRKREMIVDENVTDMTIYKDEIYYCHIIGEEYFFEKMNLDRRDKVLLSEIEARNLVVDDDYIYYIGKDYKMSRLKLIDNSIEELSEESIYKFVKDEKWIFYTQKDPEDEHRYKGLYRMDLDGDNVLVLDRDSNIDEVGLAITEDWIFYSSHEDIGEDVLKKMSKDGKDSIIIEKEKNDNDL